LEFGTWQGFGATLCAEVCDAHIWTINLPDGEKRADGKAAYSTQAQSLPAAAAKLLRINQEETIATDAGELIGWMYREAGFGHRVTQIYADSLEWEPELPEGFFDTVLIDGGHVPPVVKCDTANTIKLARSGALVMWHDFAPVKSAIDGMGATRGVVRAVAENMEEWSRHFTDFIWIRPSYILLARKI
jgi:predicted O-methyltransferase YrrM